MPKLYADEVNSITTNIIKETAAHLNRQSDRDVVFHTVQWFVDLLHTYKDDLVDSYDPKEYDLAPIDVPRKLIDDILVYLKS